MGSNAITSVNKVDIAGFRLDLARGQLRSATGEHIPLRPRSLAVLGLLARTPGEVVSKDEIISTIWNDVIVTEDSLTQCIADIRRAMGDREHRLVRTVARKGYLLAGAGTASVQTPRVEEHPTVRSRTSPVLPAGASPETRYAKSGNCYIAYQVTGEGPVDLVFVQGYVTHLELEWDDHRPADFYRQLSSFSRLIRFDKRGTGLSDRVGSLPTLEERMDDVRAVMDAAGSRRAVLLGLSEGGPMSLLFCATYPERVISLILYGAFARSAWAKDNPWGRTDAELQSAIAQHEALWGSGHSVDRFAPSVASDPNYRKWRGRVDRSAATPGDAINLFRMSHAIDVRHLLPAIDVPTLILHRKDDRAIKVEHGRFMASRISGARYMELAGQDHAPWVGDTERLCKELRAFMDVGRGVPEVERALVALLVVERIEHWQASNANAAVDAALPTQWLPLARTHLEAFLGRELGSSRAELVAVFDGPEKAIRCARSILDFAELRSLGLRAGVYSREHDLWRDGTDETSMRLGRAIARHGAPGDVITTKHVADVIAGSHIPLSPRGEHTLLGIDGTWALFASSCG